MSSDKSSDSIKDSELEESLLSDSSKKNPNKNRPSSVKSSSSNMSHESCYKYASCSICLIDFVNNEKVKVVPVCQHIFHPDCLEQWLKNRFRCPNCNIDINVENALANQ
mmetsp:Transcript_43020/g.30999  ORF Transcript_43020/g.30999 Transcript_43020/m.30999 type:complete len:109 (+) Transcript_43020:733-1059(+)